jgi:hypothetical protein
MHPSIRKVARLAYSFPVYDRVIRYKLAELDNPAVLSRLRRLRRKGQITILAVDSANEEVLIGQMGQAGPVGRHVIGGRPVTIPR